MSACCRRPGRYRGRCVAPESKNIFVRLAQHARLRDVPFRLAFSKELVEAKVRQARDRVLRYRRNRQEAEEAMDKAAAELRRIAPKIQGAMTLDELRGVEGAAAAAYFRAFDTMVRRPFVFNKRSQHPARNEVNALLNLGYTLLTLEIASTLEAQGFDPRIGFFHGIRYGRTSLALDLIEAHRIDIIDRLTLALLNRRVFAPTHFHDAGPEEGHPPQRRPLQPVPGPLRRGPRRAGLRDRQRPKPHRRPSPQPPQGRFWRPDLPPPPTREAPGRLRHPE